MIDAHPCGKRQAVHSVVPSDLSRQIPVTFWNHLENIAVNLDLAGDIRMRATMRTRRLVQRLIQRQDNDLDLAVIEAVRQLDGYPPIYDLRKQPFYLHLVPPLM